MPVYIEDILQRCPNPCPCGFFGDSRHHCTCTPSMITRYRSKVSGPLMDRIDIHIDVPAVQYKELSNEYTGEKSETIRERVAEAIQYRTLDRGQA